MLERKLNKLERNSLFILLPETKPVYNSYRKRVDELYVISKGRFAGSNYILGQPGDKPDFENSSTPVFSIGVVEIDGTKHRLSIHEEAENRIEIELDGIDNINAENGLLKELKGWSYSDWLPGSKAPNDNSEVREVKIGKDRYILVLAPSHRRLWIHDCETEVNHLIPVTNFFNELLMIKKIKKPMQSKKIFEQLESFTQQELTSAFINYARYMNKFKVDDLLIREIPAKKKRSLNIFKRRG